MKPALFLLFVIAPCLCCREHKQSDAPSKVIPIESLIVAAQSYQHQLVTVRGCFMLERSTLQPCEINKRSWMVWVETPEGYYAERDPARRSPVPVPKELRPAPKLDLIFEYSEARSRSTWAKLYSGKFTTPVKVVTVTGQFDTISPNKAVANPWCEDRVGVGGFDGHCDGAGGFGAPLSGSQFDHRLILLNVIDVKAINATNSDRER